MEYTTEEIQRNILSAYDSVNLIAEMELIQSPTEEELDTISRNKEHLTIMMGKSWFSEAITSEQTLEINSLIV